MKNLSEQLSLPALWKWIGALFVAQWTAFTVGPKAVIGALVFFMFVDWITGFAAAWMKGEVSSAAGARGLVKKGLTLLLILTIHVAEKVAGYELNLEAFGAGGFCLNEFISIIENMAKAGVPIDSRLVDGLLKAKAILKTQKASPEELRKLTEGENGHGHDS